jgi:hypothetical protein
MNECLSYLIPNYGNFDSPDASVRISNAQSPKPLFHNNQIPGVSLLILLRRGGSGSSHNIRESGSNRFPLFVVVSLRLGGGWEVISEQRATIGVLWLGFAFYFVISFSFVIGSD